jgi:hypothetical protein
MLFTLQDVPEDSGDDGFRGSNGTLLISQASATFAAAE